MSTWKKDERSNTGVKRMRKGLVLSLFMAVMLIIGVVSWSFIQKDDPEVDNLANDTTENFTPQSIPSGTDSQYDIHLTMNSDGAFQVESTVNIKNTSNDAWSDLVFYFIPNIFTEETSELLNHSLDEPAEVNLHHVEVAGKSMAYDLEQDTLTIPIETDIQPDQEVEVYFSYEFTLPDGGLRFTKSDDNYHLAHFYPMVPTYRDGQWNKEDYMFWGETYHTDFSDFNISYDIPKEYTFVSTGDGDDPDKNTGSFQVENVKEVFIAVVKNPIMIDEQVGDTNLRVLGFEDEKELYEEFFDLAADVLNYFEEKIGPYPLSQLDIVIDGLGMEYPGIVTARTIYDRPVSSDVIKNIIVHEIAHQWFYGVVSNDPYYEAWLDEGMTNFAQGLFLLTQAEEEPVYTDETTNDYETLPVNLPLDQYMDGYQIYSLSSTMLMNLFEDRGGIAEAENFLAAYYDTYQYKEVDTEEFVRFAKYYFEMDDNSEFEEWLELSE